MFDRVGLRVKDLEAAVRVYAAMLAPLGHVAGASGQGYARFGPKGAPALKAGAEDKRGPGVRADCAPR